MKEDKAEEAASLLADIRQSRFLLEDLKEEREAKVTGLDSNAPGPKNYVLNVIDKRWNILGEKCVAFFIESMNEAIMDEEAHLAILTRKLEAL